MTLDEAIAQLVDLGEYDPLTIAQKVESRHGREWLAEQLLAYAQEIVQDRARHVMRSTTRSTEVAIRPGDVVSSAVLKTKKYWVPGEGWKPAKDMTPADFEARGRWYQRLSVAHAIMAAWCFEVSGLLRDTGAKTLREFKGTLPELPDAEELEAVV